MLTSVARLPLNTLPAFVAIARQQNLRVAAEKLHLTHSAVSQQLKLLETQAGFPLFERRGRRLVINAAGQALLRAVEPALERLAEGLQAAEAAASGAATALRISALPSFAQRWLLPRIGRWRERHPSIALEVHTSQKLVDLQRDGFHAALRQGRGPWKGLHAERLIDSAVIAVAAPQRAARLAQADAATLAAEPLLGPAEVWQAWLAQGGHREPVRPVADFSDAGLMLQATEQDIGIGLARELLAADALRAGRLARLPGAAMQTPDYPAYWWVCPPELRDWAPLAALHDWLFEEIEISRAQLAVARA
jgi:LysR family glycine cleavage system transcriptional activator